MATSAEAVRSELALVTAAATAEIVAAAPDLSPNPVAGTLAAVDLIVPTYYDAAGALSVAWYDELRADAAPSVNYEARIIGDPSTDWIDREVRTLTRGVDVDAEVRRLALAMAGKEVARGFRDTMLGNTRLDSAARGWSRIARAGACKFCQMLASRGAVYRAESTAIFAAHLNCHCLAQAAFGSGPPASAIQYEASSKRARDEGTQAARNAKVRSYLNENFPSAPG